MMWRSLTVIPDVTPASDIAPHAAWEKGARGGQTDGTDIIWPGYWAGQLHQCQIFPTVRLDVIGWNHHPTHTMHWLVWVEAIKLVPADVDHVRAHIGRTERRWKDIKRRYFIVKKSIQMPFKSKMSSTLALILTTNWSLGSHFLLKLMDQMNDRQSGELLSFLLFFCRKPS